MDYPIRQESARGQPPCPSHFLRCCKTCGADFMGLAPGKTGERGIWHPGEMTWYCSVECTPGGVRKKLASR